MPPKYKIEDDIPTLDELEYLPDDVDFTIDQEQTHHVLHDWEKFYGD